MSSPTKHAHRVRGALTSWWEYGDSTGEPVVLIHGFRGDHHGLEPIALELHRYRVIVPDLPGFGASAALHEPHTLLAFAAWLRDLCATVAPNGFHLVGHSFGSLVVAQAVALGVSPLTLALINPISAPALEGPRALLTKAAVLYYRLGALLPERLANKLLSHDMIVRIMSESMAKTQDRQLRAWIHEQHQQFFSTYTDRESLLEAFTASVTHSVNDVLSGASMPTTVIAGELDDITTLDHQLRLVRSIRVAQLHVIPGSGHLVHYEQPALAAEYIERMINSASAAEHRATGAPVT